MPSKLCHVYLQGLCFSKRHFKSTTRLQLSGRKLVQIQDRAYERYTRFGHTFKILPVNYQPPLQHAGSIDTSVPDVLLKPPSLDTQRHFSFDVVANLSLVLPTVQERNQGSCGERHPVGRPAGFFWVPLTDFALKHCFSI